jgi:hypothetical protein
MTRSLKIRRLRSATGLLCIAIGSATLLAPTVSLAHHAFAAEYDGDKPIALEGVVERVRFVNPHSWLYINVTGADGKVTKWALEFGSPNSLTNAGLSKDDVKPGSRVKIKGFGSKGVLPIGYCSVLTLPDGRSVKTGGAGDAPGTANSAN